MVTTKSQLIHELPSEMVKEVFFESMRWYSNTSGTLIEFKFTEDSSKALENKKQKVSNENLGQNSSSHYLETFSKKSIIDPDDEVFPN